MRIFFEAWHSMFDNRPISTDVLAFCFFNKSMGVATYHTYSHFPAQYRGILPEPAELINLMYPRVR